MPVTVRATIVGGRELQARLAKLNPKQNRQIMTYALKNIAVVGMRDAKKRHILARGKRPPVARRLTSRTGTGRRSIGLNLGGPVFAEYGTDLGYMAMHEEGGTFPVKQSLVREHTRRKAFGKRRKAFTVPMHTRKAHSMRVPPRPFLEPSMAMMEKRGPDILLKALERYS